MNSSRSQLIELIEQGAIPAGKIGDALIATKITPDGKAWHAFLDRLLLWLGGLALAFAVMFFVAYNWNDIGRLAKFGMVEIVIVLAITAYCRRPARWRCLSPRSALASCRPSTARPTRPAPIPGNCSLPGHY